MDVLLKEKKNQILYLTLNRPEKLNAFSMELTSSLITALKEAEADDDVKVIILTGAGKSFCAGGDVSSMGSRRDPATAIASMQNTSKVTKTILQLDKYVISAVHGYAAGAGFSLALASDFIIADQHARFVSSFKNIGLVPDLGLIKLLSERVSLPIAKEWISSAKIVSAEEAYAERVINRIATKDLLEVATEFAQFIVDGPPLANKFVKYMLNNASDFSHEASIMQENIIQTLMFQTEDAKEGVRAFAEKRSPDFKGK
ncbi:enoyl-CoA hydratase/isomerase family protein [Solibacillus sp. FSL K6-1523]|uniref:enoyl-CoA hydratase/isomerase family protein n=1 Tax=Solibacillus sp. FSL K6-1523 TaxID=2921471 RepID=UPI0030F6BD87